VSAVLAREREVHRLLTRERILGLDLIKGRKKAAEPPGEAAPDGEQRAARSEEEAAPVKPADDGSRPGEPRDEETAGLPLFGADDEE
jgi:hypothetical protein